jgi:hypothetical protein
MDNRKRIYDDDDGRTVADMSQIEKPIFRLSDFRRNRKTKTEPGQSAGEGQSCKPDRSERSAILGGAVAAGLAVAGALALGFALLILLIQWIW